MSTHPNAMLLVAITPDDLSRKTARLLREAAIAAGFETDDSDGDDFDIGIPNGKTYQTVREPIETRPEHDDYHVHVMEDDYYESMQIAAKTGQIVMWDLVTYGYGERVTWTDLEAQKNRLTAWLDSVKNALHFTYEVYISANYW